MVSVSCFGVRFSVMFHFMFVHYTFSSVEVETALTAETVGTQSDDSAILSEMDFDVGSGAQAYTIDLPTPSEPGSSVTVHISSEDTSFSTTNWNIDLDQIFKEVCCQQLADFYFLFLFN